MIASTRFLFSMFTIAMWILVNADLPGAMNPTWGDLGDSLNPRTSIAANYQRHPDDSGASNLRVRRYSTWGDVGASLSPVSSIAANHRQHPG